MQNNHPRDRACVAPQRAYENIRYPHKPSNLTSPISLKTLITPRILTSLILAPFLLFSPFPPSSDLTLERCVLELRNTEQEVEMEKYGEELVEKVQKNLEVWRRRREEGREGGEETEKYREELVKKVIFYVHFFHENIRLFS